MEIKQNEQKILNKNTIKKNMKVKEQQRNENKKNNQGINNGKGKMVEKKTTIEKKEKKKPPAPLFDPIMNGFHAPAKSFLGKQQSNGEKINIFFCVISDITSSPYSWSLRKYFVLVEETWYSGPFCFILFLFFATKTVFI